MNGYITKGDGWMSYHLHIDGENKTRRIYWRNHNQTYIKNKGVWVQVYFNHWLLEKFSEFDEVPMRLTPDGEWEMVHKYTQMDGGASAQYVIV